MFPKKKGHDPQNKSDPATHKDSGNASGDLRVRAAAGEMKTVSRTFPGPRGAQSPLRIAVDRSAYAELISHAKESLEAEICGVLAGTVCEDDEGPFVHVEAIIRGTAATQGSTHVTFTHATWDAIHQALDRDHPKLRIVGWYHSHPGFGVEFSEMDLFIQRNFFSSPTQVAWVTDPLSGAVAICVNSVNGIEYLPRFWVDGREQTCKTPERPEAESRPSSETQARREALAQRIQDLETRVGQLVLAVDDQRTALHRFLLFAGSLFAVALIAVTVYAFYLRFQERIEPPRNIGFAPVPVKVGDHTALLGVQVVSWQLPPELDAVQQALDKLKRELDEQAANNSNAPAPAITNRPSQE